VIRTLICTALLPASLFAQSHRNAAVDASTAIAPSWIAPHVRFLSDSTLEGRDTASRGYDLAANYVATQFELLGLEPGGDHGTYFQTVPIRKSSVASASLVLDSPSGAHELQLGRDFFVHASGGEDGIDAAGPLIFASFGVTVPENHYDDYVSVDVRGKIVVLLPGTPASLPLDVRAVHSTLKSRVHNAKAHSALAVVVLWPDMPAALVQEKQIRQLDATMWIDTNGRAQALEYGDGYAIVPKEGVGAILANQPLSIQELRKRTAEHPFWADLNAKATLRARFDHLDMKTVNIAAIVRGGDLASEYVAYTAHLDHDGVSQYFEGDHVLHGALDNAGGVATILAVARAFRGAPNPRRSIIFVALTGEEKGLVGSDYFVHYPTVPRASIVADINCDNFLWYFPLKDIGGIGIPYSTLDTDFAAVAARMGLAVSPMLSGAPHLFVLTDHYSFLNAGIPALSVFNGEASGGNNMTGSEIFAAYMRDIHHTPKDSINQAIDWNAAATESRFVFLLGEQVANDANRPHLNEKAFFAQHGE